MKVLVKRLDQALRYWEDFCCMDYWLAKCERELIALGKAVDDHPTPIEGAASNWKNLRGDILKGVSLDDIDDKYIVGAPAGSPLQPLPLGLAAWSRGSRRVFNLTNDLLTLLSLTSLEGVRWSDVPWPFASFLVTLDRPLIDGYGSAWDSVLVYRIAVAEGEMVGFHLFSQSLDTYRPLDFFDKEELERLYRKRPKGVERFGSKINGWFQKWKDLPVSLHVPLPPRIEDRLVTESYKSIVRSFEGDEGVELAEREGLGNPTVDAAIRVVIGLSLYLATLPATNNSNQQSVWENVPSESKKNDPKAITREAQICTVSSTYRLSRDEQQIIESLRGRPHAEMCAHWRRGHWRKSPGQGNNPDAPKHIWVRPALVRKDRLKPGELPGGAVALVAK